MSSNGYLTDSELKTIPWDRHFRVSADIYANVLAFGEAFKARFGNYPAIESAYRPYAEQDYLYKLYGYPRSVPPGTSNHGWGRAIDWKSNINTYGSAEWNFMNTEGRKFGFAPLNSNNLKFEPWHWQDLVSTVSNPGFNLPPIPVIPDIPPVVSITPIVPTVQEDDMLGLIVALYDVGYGRAPIQREIDNRLIDAARDSKSAHDIYVEFWNEQADAGTVQRAFTDYLKHDPSALQITQWTAPGMTIKSVREGIAGSGEALALK